MKKALCMIALAAISFGSVFAHGVPVKSSNGSMQTDTTKKKMKKKMKKDTTMKKDTMKMKK
ncbi:hypothetical protein [Mucilaginibacter sp.]|uniref:hypothetical protein n=1 Tax=Mucilaginibacter sp. TaxID=1882438 RepID=UPI0025DDED89|nr:hypothetical protein [Mucilaginibacter sp.]